MSLASQTHFVIFTELSKSVPVTVNLAHVITGTGVPGNYNLVLSDGTTLTVIETIEEVVGL
jgi:hypothetical protein